MTDSLSNIIPTIIAAFETVTAGIVGFAGGVPINGDLSERAALGQTIEWPEPNVGTPKDAVPGCTGPCGDPLTASKKLVTIEKQRSIPIAVTGDQFKGLQGNIYPFLKRAFIKAIRQIVTEVDVYMAIKAIENASRAWGTAGTAPFGTLNDMTDFAGLKQIFRENGHDPANLDLRLTLNNAAMFNIEGKMSNIWKANEFGSDELSRWGYITEIEGFRMGTMPNIPQHVKGTGAGYVTSGATAIDVEDIALVTGAGTVLAGDVVTFAADPNRKYVVNKGIAAPGTITIGEPGARMVIPTGNAMTIGNSYSPNVAYDADAMLFLCRPPAVPAGGDSAVDSVLLQDPVSRLVIEVAQYKQYLQETYDVRIAYGATVVDPSLVALLLG